MSKTKYISYKNPQQLENKLYDLLDCGNVVLYDDGGEGYICIDDIFKLEYKDKKWNICYCLEYGEMDKYGIFEIEEQAIFGYQYLKDIYQDIPTLMHNRDFPYSEITIGFIKNRLSLKFIRDFYECTKNISDYDFRKVDKTFKYEKIDIFFSELTFREHFQLEPELEYLGYCNYLRLLGFNRHKNHILNEFEKDNFRVGLSEISRYEEKIKETIEKKKPLQKNI